MNILESQMIQLSELYIEESQSKQKFDKIIHESNQNAIAKEIKGMNKIFHNKLKKNSKIYYEIHKASSMELAGYRFATGVLTNKEKDFGGIWVITLYNDDNKKIGTYYTCNFKNSDIDNDIKSKIKKKVG